MDGWITTGSCGPRGGARDEKKHVAMNARAPKAWLRNVRRGRWRGGIARGAERPPVVGISGARQWERNPTSRNRKPVLSVERRRPCSLALFGNIRLGLFLFFWETVALELCST